MQLGLKDKKIIVTGAANGIGSAIFQALLKEKAFPIGFDFEELRNSELEEKIKEYKISNNFDFFQADVCDEERLNYIFKTHIKEISGLVNNAGVLGGDDAHGGRTNAAWDKMLNAHAKSAFLLTELSYPKMNNGSIVNIGSIELEMAAPGVVLYTAAKGALLGLTVSYSTHLAPNIRVNIVSPGNVNTKRNLAQYKEHKELVDAFEEKTPLKRSVEPEEVADLVLFLLSDKAKAITGQNHIIDCGYTKALWDPIWSKKDLNDVYKQE